MNLVRQLKEVIISVLPIVVLASLSSLLLGVMDASELCRFLFSSVLVIIGLTLFLSGVDVGLLPIGNRIGSALTRTRSLAIMLSVAVVLGIIITIPEPDVQVLAEQVEHQAHGSLTADARQLGKLGDGSFEQYGWELFVHLLSIRFRGAKIVEKNEIRLHSCPPAGGKLRRCGRSRSRGPAGAL